VPSAYETAYPRLRNSVSDEELNRCYAPTADDLTLASQIAKGTGPKICFLVLLKTFLRLGCFVRLHEMLRVAVSIKAGKLLPSAALRRLGSYSRHNWLHQAYREHGRVVRTGFLLNYVNDLELRRVIQVAMNKSERFNQFTQWAAFGNKGVVTENDRVEQQKRIKYHHLVANCLIFHNVHAMTQALHKMAGEGVTLSEEALRHLSQYLTEHVNRFGVHEWNPQRRVPAINYGLPILQTRSGSEG
jgi:hypothetical protein